MLVYNTWRYEQVTVPVLLHFDGFDDDGGGQKNERRTGPFCGRSGGRMEWADMAPGGDVTAHGVRTERRRRATLESLREPSV